MNPSEINAIRGEVTVFTSTTPANLGKPYWLENDKLVKGKPEANMTQGEYRVVPVDSADGLAKLLATIGTNQALCHSVPRTDDREGLIVTKKAAAKRPRPGQLARTKDDFTFREQPGVMVLDYDPNDPQHAFTRDELWAKLTTISRAIATAQCVWWCSGSSHIHSPVGELQGLRGQRFYLLIQDASDIERAGRNLADRCWLGGLGQITIGNAGQQLKRTLFDEAVHEPARLDFIGGAICTPPLFQQRGQPEVLGGADWLDTRQALPALDEHDAASVARLIADAKDAAAPAAAAARATWKETQIPKMAAKLLKDGKLTHDEATHQARQMCENALSGTLTGDYEIPLPGDKFVTVDEVLNNPDKWHKTKTLDPLNPAHRNFEDCGILYLDGASQCLFSFAHGGTRYKLARQARRVEYRNGDIAATADALAQVLCEQRDLFLSMGEIVRAGQGGFKPLSSQSDLQYQLEKVVTMFQQTAQGPKVRNIPGELIGLTRAALGASDKQTLPTLTGVTSLPYATVDRRVVTEPGYNQQTGIYNTMVETPAPLPKTVTRQGLIDALKTIYAPWRDYQLATDADRGAMLASIFTAVLRPAMRIAPGTFFDAPIRGSGKTKAALALGALMHGEHVAVRPFVAGDQEAELSKSLVALLRSTRRHLIIDNVKGTFTSAIYEALGTGGKVSGRILGVSIEEEYDARILLLATGNNAQLGADLARRLMVVRIDTGRVRPEEVTHTFEPDDVALKTRMGIAHAVLTILKAYWAEKQVTRAGGSDFAEWSLLVRDPIIWLAQQEGLTQAAGIGTITDPQNAISKDDGDPDTAALGQLLQGMASRFGTRTTFYTRDVFECLAVENGRISTNSCVLDELTQIRESVEELMSASTITKASLGKILQFRTDRPHACGFKLVAVKKGTNKGTAWQVVTV